MQNKRPDSSQQDLPTQGCTTNIRTAWPSCACYRVKNTPCQRMLSSPLRYESIRLMNTTPSCTRQICHLQNQPTTCPGLKSCSTRLASPQSTRTSHSNQDQLHQRSESEILRLHATRRSGQRIQQLSQAMDSRRSRPILPGADQRKRHIHSRKHRCRGHTREISYSPYARRRDIPP